MHKGTGRALLRRAAPLAAASLLALHAAACGDGGGGGQASAPSTVPAAVTTASTQPGTTVQRGGPRWETVTTYTGSGPSEPPPFTILADSIQWRVRWQCDAGRLRVTTDPPPRRGTPLVDTSCPLKGEGFSIVTGDVRIKIEAAGHWDIVIDQQVDTPLREPPLEGMEAVPVFRQGTFYPVEKEAKGTATISKRPDGTSVLRLEDFEVSTNVDLFVWLSEAAAPKTSAEAIAAPYEVLGNLKSTLGNQNYVIPANLAPERFRSIVIWCAPIRIAYGVAALA